MARTLWLLWMAGALGVGCAASEDVAEVGRPATGGGAGTGGGGLDGSAGFGGGVSGTGGVSGAGASAGAGGTGASAGAGGTGASAGAGGTGASAGAGGTAGAGGGLGGASGVAGAGGAAGGTGGTGGAGGGTGGAGGGTAGAGGGTGGASGGTAGAGGGTGGASGGTAGAGGGTGGASGGTGGASGGTGGMPAHDTCPGETVALVGTGTAPRTASVTGSNSGLTNDTSSAACSGFSSGRDVVYSFTPDVSGIARLSLSGTYDATLFVRSTCAATGSAAEIACSEAFGASGTEQVTFLATAGVTYSAWVDAYSTSGQGTFTLDISVTPEPPDEKCPGEAVAWTGSGSATRTASVSGTTTDAWNDYDQSCDSAAGGKDRVYAFTADTDGILELALGSSFDAVLSVRTICDGAELACLDSGGASAVEGGQLWAAAGTTYFAHVDGYGSSAAGTFTLDASLSPVTGEEKCPGEAVAWTGTDPATFSVTGDTDERWHDTASTSCGSGSARDTVYALTAPGDGILKLTLTPSQWDSILYLRSTCETAGSQVACVDNSSTPETHERWVTAGQTLYAFVDGYSTAQGGAYSFSGTFAPQQPEEECPGADLTFAGAPLGASTAGNLGSRWNDLSGSCGGTSGRDAVYHFVPPQAGTVRIRVQPTGFDAIFYVAKGCGGGTPLLTCRDQGGSGSAETYDLVVSAGDAGTDYYVVVDGYNTGAGAYTLTLTYQ